jgi:hypothetical protein
MKDHSTRIDDDFELDLSRADRFVTPADCVRDPYGRKLDPDGNPIGEIPDTTKGRELYDLPPYTSPAKP